MAIRVSHHRRFTANNTWHVDWRERQLFVKANPNHADALAERAGHGRLHGFYPVPHLHGVVRIGRWTFTAYDRWPHLGLDHGLLADVIAHADLTQDRTVLDRCLTAMFATYRQAIEASVVRTALGRTMSKLYGERVTPGGRLDSYYGTDRPWRFGPAALRPSELRHRLLVANGRQRQVRPVERQARRVEGHHLPARRH